MNMALFHGRQQLILCILGNFLCRNLRFKINFFENFFQEYNLSVKQIGSHIRPNISSGLIWVQTVCKGYQQTTVGHKELKEQSVFEGSFKYPKHMFQLRNNTRIPQKVV